MNGWRALTLVVCGLVVCAFAFAPGKPRPAPAARSGAAAPPVSAAPVPQPAAIRSPVPAASLTLTQIRQKVAYPVFVPAGVPEGQAPSIALRSEFVEVTFRNADGSVRLAVLNGPAGCCLDAAQKGGQNIVVRGNSIGHYLINQREFGGPILWWNEAGTYITLSGPDLTQEDLLKAAASLSATADLHPAG